MPPTEPAVPQEPKKVPNLRRNLDWLIRSTSLCDVLDELARHAEAEAKTAFMAGDTETAEFWHLAYLRLHYLANGAAESPKLAHQGLLRHPLPSAPPAGELLDGNGHLYDGTGTEDEA